MPYGRYRKVKQSSSKGLEKFLGQLELVVMDIAWTHETVSVSEVLQMLKEKSHDLAYTTVMTIMGRLAEKGWLTVEKQGRAYLYRAASSRQAAEAQAVGSVLRALLEDFGDVAVAQFVKELDDIDPNQLTRLAKLLQENNQEDTHESS